MIHVEQQFPNGLNRTSVPNDYDSVISAFPSFRWPDRDQNIGYLSFGGMMAGDMQKIYGRWNQDNAFVNDGIEGGPLVLFNTQGDTLIIAPMSEFMAASMHHNYAKSSLDLGIMSGVDQIPANFSIDFLVFYANNGINKVSYMCNTVLFLLPNACVFTTKFAKAMREWGDLMLKFYKKNASQLAADDFTANYLSYWIDNGKRIYSLLWSVYILSKIRRFCELHAFKAPTTTGTTSAWTRTTRRP